MNADGNDRQILADVTRWQARNRIDHYLHYLRDGTGKYPGGKFPKVQESLATSRWPRSDGSWPAARTLADTRPVWNVEIEKTINCLQWDKRSPEGELRSD